jgi:hypothetical protein
MKMVEEQMPNILNAPSGVTNPTSIQARKDAHAKHAMQIVQQTYQQVLASRNFLRDAFWRGGTNLSPQQAWDAMGTLGASLANIAAAVDQMLVAIQPGVTTGDAGVPDAFELTYNADGSAVCTAKQS